MSKRKRPRNRARDGRYPDTPSRHGSRMYDTMYDAIDALPHSGSVQLRLAWAFFGDAVPSHVDDEAESHAIDRFMEWAAFAMPLPPADESLAEQALHTLPPSLTADELDELRAFWPPRYSFYRVVRTMPEQERFEVDDTVHNQRLLVHEPLGSQALRPESILVGALHQVPDGFVMSPGMCVFSPLDYPHPPAFPDVRGEDLAPALERAVYGANSDWILACDLADLAQTYGAFARALDLTGNTLPRLRALQQRIRKTQSPAAVISDVVQAANPWTLHEAEILMHLVQRLWNLTPRDELGGRSPDEMVQITGSGGPQETMLMEQGMDYVMKGLGGKQRGPRIVKDDH